MSLSVKNGWLDEQNRVFIIFTIEDVKRALCCADNKFDLRCLLWTDQMITEHNNMANFEPVLLMNGSSRLPFRSG